MRRFESSRPSQPVRSHYDFQRSAVIPAEYGAFCWWIISLYNSCKGSPAFRIFAESLYAIIRNLHLAKSRTGDKPEGELPPAATIGSCRAYFCSSPSQFSLTIHRGGHAARPLSMRQSGFQPSSASIPKSRPRKQQPRSAVPSTNGAVPVEPSMVIFCWAAAGWHARAPPSATVIARVRSMLMLLTFSSTHNPRPYAC